MLNIRVVTVCGNGTEITTKPIWFFFLCLLSENDQTASRSRTDLQPLLLQRISTLQWTLPAFLYLISSPLYLSLTISWLPMHLPPPHHYLSARPPPSPFPQPLVLPMSICLRSATRCEPRLMQSHWEVLWGKDGENIPVMCTHWKLINVRLTLCNSPPTWLKPALSQRNDSFFPPDLFTGRYVQLHCLFPFACKRRSLGGPLLTSGKMV